MKIPTAFFFFAEIDVNPNTHMKVQETQNKQKNPGGKKVWETQISQFQNLLQSYSHQGSVVLVSE